jgi:hypothetical protein
MPAQPGNTGTPYSLPYPGDNEVADVPQDMLELAEKVEDALDQKMQKTGWFDQDNVARKGTDELYQTRIVVVDTVPTSATGYAEGDVVFVIPTTQ